MTAAAHTTSVRVSARGGAGRGGAQGRRQRGQNGIRLDPGRTPQDQGTSGGAQPPLKCRLEPCPGLESPGHVGMRRRREYGPLRAPAA